MVNNDDVRKKKFLYEKIASLLERDIINGCFPDQKLPPEQELSDRYSASRTVIREALKILGERHLVYSVVGSGAYITRPDANDLSTIINRLISTHNIGMMDAIDVRIIIESNAAALAALNATPEEFDEMDRVRDRLAREVLPTEERIMLDYEFHALICQASHNDMLAMLARAIGNVVRELISMNIVAGKDNPDILRHISHARILRALRERNPIAAQNVVYDHLYSTKMLYEKYISDNITNK